MKIQAGDLPGLRFVDREPWTDERGSFARLFDDEQFGSAGMVSRFEQVSLAHSARRGTLRGLHYQTPPHGETKLITCVRGRGFDVVVDIREDSPTRWRWSGQQISADGVRSLYVPQGFAHGFLALEDATTLLYQIAGRYEPSAARGLRWDDPRIGIVWPEPPLLLSARDARWALLD